jgi:hypothetical protein
VSYIIKEALPELTTVTLDNVEIFKSIDDVVILAYVSPEDDFLQEIVTEVANEKHKEYVFGLTTDERVAKSQNLSVPSLAAYKRRDGDHMLIAGQYDKETLLTFLRVSIPTVIGDITKRSIQDFVGVSCHVPTMLVQV